MKINDPIMRVEKITSEENSKKIKRTKKVYELLLSREMVFTFYIVSELV